MTAALNKEPAIAPLKLRPAFSFVLNCSTARVIPPRLSMTARIRPSRYGIEKNDNATLPTIKDKRPRLTRSGLAESAFPMAGACCFEAGACAVFAGTVGFLEKGSAIIKIQSRYFRRWCYQGWRT